MLIEFRFKNYRSFRDETTLSMEATGIGTFKNSLIPYGSMNLLPGAAIFGKNGGGKSNVIRAFWLAVQFIRNAQRTQHEKATIPVIPFALNDYSASDRLNLNFSIRWMASNTGMLSRQPRKKSFRNLCIMRLRDSGHLYF